jgi:hypothetical protein
MPLEKQKEKERERERERENQTKRVTTQGFGSIPSKSFPYHGLE